MRSSSPCAKTLSSASLRTLLACAGETCGHALGVGGPLSFGSGGHLGLRLLGIGRFRYSARSSAQAGRRRGGSRRRRSCGVMRASRLAPSGLLPPCLGLFLLRLDHQLAIDGDPYNFFLGRDLHPVDRLGGIFIGQRAEKMQPVARACQLDLVLEQAHPSIWIPLSV